MTLSPAILDISINVQGLMSIGGSPPPQCTLLIGDDVLCTEFSLCCVEAFVCVIWGLWSALCVGFSQCCV